VFCRIDIKNKIKYIFKQKQGVVVLETRWSFYGENVKEKLVPSLERYGLKYVEPDGKNREFYNLDLISYKQYEDLETLAETLDLVLRIRHGAEWLACLYYDLSK